MTTLTDTQRELLTQTLEVTAENSRGTDAFTGERLDSDADIARKVSALALVEYLRTSATLNPSQRDLALSVVEENLARVQTVAAARTGQPVGAMMDDLAESLSALVATLEG